MKKTGPINQELQKLIQSLRKEHSEKSVSLWKRVADDLSKSSRQRRVVNLNRISRHVKDGETVLVPGKVLGTGELSQAVTIAAFSFSNSAKETIAKAKGKCLSIQELMKSNPKGQKVRILG